MVHPGSYTYQGYTYGLDKCYLDHYVKKGSLYEMGVWLVSSGISIDPEASSGFQGKGDYVGFELVSSDTTLTPGDYVFSDSGEPMTWYEAEFGHPFDWTQGEGNWAWLVDGVLNVSKQNGVYTFIFTATSETGYELTGYYTGGVIYTIWSKKKR